MSDRTNFLATVSSVSAAGITLKFDGDEQPTTKRYKYNTAIKFSVGQRVKVAKISGTYIVEYPIS